MIDKTQNPAEIYLVPVFDGEHDHVWCDTPAPGEGMREEDATRYVREDIKDKYLNGYSGGPNSDKAANYTGLTKREYFAGLAAGLVMQECISSRSRYGSWDGFAAEAVELADAILAELERTK